MCEPKSEQDIIRAIHEVGFSSRRAADERIRAMDVRFEEHFPGIELCARTGLLRPSQAELKYAAALAQIWGEDVSCEEARMAQTETQPAQVRSAQW